MNNVDAALEDTNIFSAPGAPTVSPFKTPPPPKKDACVTAVCGDLQKLHTSLALDLYVNQNLRNLCEICIKSFVLKIISRYVVLKISSSQFRNNHVVL